MVILRWLVTLLLLGIITWRLELAVVVRQFSNLAPGWLLLALLVTPVQVVLSAWRWRYTLARLGFRLPLWHAVREYYLATLINQVLPGGVAGDAGRAIRQGRASGDWRRAAHGVMLERFSGQLVLILVCAGAVYWLAMTMTPDAFSGLSASNGFWLLLILPLIVLGARHRRVRSWLRAFRRDAQDALLRWPAPVIQLLTSLAVLASYLLVFLLLARALGQAVVVTNPVLLVALCCLLLLAMVIPLTVSGWGIREGAAALAWPLVGLPAEQGVALSVSYGLLVLVSALPGALFIRYAGSRERRACQSPD